MSDQDEMDEMAAESQADEPESAAAADEGAETLTAELDA